jgi:hypothetical protein
MYGVTVLENTFVELNRVTFVNKPLVKIMSGKPEVLPTVV